MYGRIARIALLLWVVIVVPCLAVPREQTLTVQSGGRPIQVDAFLPDDGSRLHPAVIVLHGTSGLGGPTSHLEHLCRSMATAGYAVYRVHYFDRTGHVTASVPDTYVNGAVWLATVDDAVRQLSLLPEVNGQRVALLGVSLGGALALTEASNNPIVRLVIDFFGRVDWPVRANSQRMVPTLVLHGEEDAFIPASDAREIVRRLEEQHVPYECHIYPGEGHGFSSEGMRQAESQVLEFLKRL